MTITRVFQVDGKPFFPVGGQVHNSSGYDQAAMQKGWEALERIHANFAEIPVYWEQVEPEEGRFDFSSVSLLLEGARSRGMKLVLLWFATWKNGMMRYAPPWVKKDKKRFKRVFTADGIEIANLSATCQATFDADMNAYGKFLLFLKENDAEHRTVIGVQIQNEPGILGSDRDYSPEAEGHFRSDVPSEFIQAIADRPVGPLYRAWMSSGGNTKGSWPEVFGRYAGEYMTAWHISRFVGEMGRLGKELYDVPMFTNVWLGSDHDGVPGMHYPAGGPTANVLDIWKRNTPALDLIAPDIYKGSHRAYTSVCAAYDRPDNPLFIPESGCRMNNALNMFYAVANYNAIGYAGFGIEDILIEGNEFEADYKAFVSSIRCLRYATPLLLEHQGTGRVHAIVQEEFTIDNTIELDSYLVIADFSQSSERGRGLLIQAGDNEFYAVGDGYRLLFVRKAEHRHMMAFSQAQPGFYARFLNFVHAEEGYFDNAGQWTAVRRLNGDETDHGIKVHAEAGVVRLVMED